MAVTKRFIKYLLGGVIGYPLKIGLTALLTESFGIYYLHSYIITQFVMAVYFFTYNYFIAFTSKKKKRSALIAYLFSYACFAFLDVFVVKTITDHAGLFYLISIIITTGVIVIIKFIAYDHFVFNTAGYVERFLNRFKKNNH